MKTQYAVIFEHDENGWGASVPDLPGCFSAGDTLEDAKRHVLEAIDLHIEGLVANGMEVPEPMTVVEMVDRPA